MIRNAKSRWAILLVILWIASSNFSGLVGYPLLIATHQIKYVGILSDRKLPLIFAFGFEYTENSLLKYLSPTMNPLNPSAGLNNGIFIAFDSIKVTHRPGVLTHELRHTWQRALGGPLQILAYSGWNHLAQAMGYSSWEAYLSNPFERDAYNFSGELTKYNELIDEHAPKLSNLKFK